MTMRDIEKSTHIFNWANMIKLIHGLNTFSETPFNELNPTEYFKIKQVQINIFQTSFYLNSLPF